MTKIIDHTATEITIREYGKTRIASRFAASVNDGRGTANIIDRVTGEIVNHVVGVHTEGEAIAAHLAEMRFA